MSETPTPQEQSPIDQALEDAKYLERLTEAARRTTLESSPDIEPPLEEEETDPSTIIEPPEDDSERPSTGHIPRQRTGAAGVLAASVALAAAVTATGAAANSDPEFSEETKTVTVQTGDELKDIVEDEIEGGTSIDYRDGVAHIQSDPVNIDELKDGLHPGESIEVPIKVEQ